MKNKKDNVGKVYRGKTKYIDKETKDERNYVVVRESNRGVAAVAEKPAGKGNKS